MIDYRDMLKKFIIYGDAVMDNGKYNKDEIRVLTFLIEEIEHDMERENDKK